MPGRRTSVVYDAAGGSNGIEKQNVAPGPVVFGMAQIPPPWASTIERLTARLSLGQSTLAPVQVSVLPLSTELRAYADEVVAALRAAGLRAELDAREEKVGRKIHDAEVGKVPVMLVLGGREAEARSVAVRRRGGVDLGVSALDDVVAALAAEAQSRALAAPASE